MKKEWPFFFQNAAFSIGDGKRVSLWKDVWCGEEVLCYVFPSLFNLDVHKEAMVVDIWDCGKEERGWSTTFLRSLNDWQIEEVERFMLILHR